MRQITYSNQRAFDLVWDHFITRKQPRSISKDGRCSYRSRRGAKRCAIGVLIPDDRYDRSFDSDKVRLTAVLKQAKIKIDVDFASQLQITHDRSANREDLRESLLHLAERCDLKLPK